MLFCIKVTPMHKEAESFPPMILLLLFPYYIRNLYPRHNLNQ